MFKIINVFKINVNESHSIRKEKCDKKTKFGFIKSLRIKSYYINSVYIFMKNKKTFHDIPNFNLIAATLLIMVKPNFILSLMLIDFSIGFSKTTDRTENVSRIHQPLTHRPINRLLLTYLKTIFFFFFIFSLNK